MKTNDIAEDDGVIDLGAFTDQTKGPISGDLEDGVFQRRAPGGGLTDE